MQKCIHTCTPFAMPFVSSTHIPGLVSPHPLTSESIILLPHSVPTMAILALFLPSVPWRATPHLRRMCSLWVKETQPFVLRHSCHVVPSPFPQTPCPDTYRGEHRDPETAGHLYALEVKRLIDEAHSKGKKVGGKHSTCYNLNRKKII